MDRRSGRRHPSAQAWMADLWDRNAGCVSFQVLQEFYANALRKAGVSRRDARSIVKSYEDWKPEQPGLDMLERAGHWCNTAKINFWDALIVASAEQAGCRWLLSEDFQPARKFGQLTVVDPFEHSPSEFGMARR